jgi:hypothetical protein
MTILMTRSKLLMVALVLAVPGLAQAGPPLICHPFQTAGGPLLPWGAGPGWNTPDRSYKVQRLTDDVLTLLDDGAPILTRMENIRRAVIYATRDAQVAEQLLTAVQARANAPNASRLATFDAGYLIESYKQATHLFGRSMTSADGYAMVVRALNMGEADPAMHFAAALMTTGAASTDHLRRARTAATAESLLAKNINNMGW